MNTKIDKNIFKHDLDYYTNNVNPVEDYISQASLFLSKKRKIEIKEARKLVIQALKKSNIKDPMVTFNSKQDNGDVTVERMPLTHYIKTARDNNYIIVPSFTCYYHPSKKISYISKFMVRNVDDRAKYKHLAFKYSMMKSPNALEQEKFDTLANNNNTKQGAKKTNNNGASGALASMSTHLYNKSGHSSLTSITRNVASTGNAISESFIAGNKLFIDYNSILGYFMAIVDGLDKELIKETIEKFNLVIPTVDDIMKNVTFCSDRYFHNPRQIAYIRELVETFDEYERTAVLYTNDFRSIAELNTEFVKEYILNIATIRYDDPELKTREDMLNAIDNCQDGIMILVHHICMEHIRGMLVNYKELEEDKLRILASTGKYIAEYLTNNKKLMEAFFTTNVPPCNIAKIRNMLRECIVLSDTDSTCGSYEWYVKLIRGYNDTSPVGVGISAAVMTVNTQVMDHNIRILTGNMNIDKERVNRLKMKNEFFWYLFATMNQSKHYFADTAIKEGMVFDKTKPELKGVNMIAGNICPKYRDMSRQMMEDIKLTIKENKKIDIFEYVKKVADIEREIIDKVKKADIDILKMDKIKELKAYKGDSPSKTPYFHYLLWKELFADMYGDPGEPTYFIAKVPLLLDSEKKLSDYLDNLALSNPNLAHKFRAFLDKHDKKQLGTFRPPLSIIKSSGLPKEILDIIDYKTIVKDNCLVFYMILESIGFYKKDEPLICEMGLY